MNVPVTNPPDAGDAGELSRSERKRQQILEGAGEVFLEAGFEGASVDDIAKRAGVSKATLYNHFADKRELFSVFLEEHCRKHAQRVFEVDADAGDLEATLRGIARNAVELTLSPFGLGAYRVAVAEARRFPELARVFFDSGPYLACRRLAQILAVFVGRGDLEIDDVDLAAQQLGMLCHAELHDKVLFRIRQSVTKREMHRIADAAVDMFLRAYRRTS